MKKQINQRPQTDKHKDRLKKNFFFASLFKVMGKKGFSLTELLVAAAILPILALIGFKYFGDQKEKAYKSATQKNMIDLLSLMKTAQKNDGHYHQFIYQMGYRPKGSLISNIGVKADNSAPCGSSSYPALGAAGCSKLITSGGSTRIEEGKRCPYGTKNSGNFESGVCKGAYCYCSNLSSYESYRYYNCDGSPLGKATDVLTICGSSGYSYKCSFKGGDPSAITSSTSFGACDSKAVCASSEIALGAISESFSEKLVLHSSGDLCID